VKTIITCQPAELRIYLSDYVFKVRGSTAFFASGTRDHPVGFQEVNCFPPLIPGGARKKSNTTPHFIRASLDDVFLLEPKIKHPWQWSEV